MRRLSARSLMFRRGKLGVEVFLVHPGGPVCSKKDFGAWSIPKGEVLAGEDDVTAARREFEDDAAGQLHPGSYG